MCECERCGEPVDEEFLQHGYCETCWDNLSNFDKYMEAAQPVFPFKRKEKK